MSSLSGVTPFPQIESDLQNLQLPLNVSHKNIALFLVTALSHDSLFLQILYGSKNVLNTLVYTQRVGDLSWVVPK